jgi:integrase
MKTGPKNIFFRRGFPMNTVQPIRDAAMVGRLKDAVRRHGDKYYIMLLIGLNTGLRISDILKLKVGDIRDRTHIVLTEKKTGKHKRILINRMLRDELASYTLDMDADAYLIRSRQGGNRPVTRVRAYMVLNQSAAALRISEVGTHTMRKTFGYFHYRQFRDIAILQQIFNHSSPSTTLKYIGINDDMMDDSLKEFCL